VLDLPLPGAADWLGGAPDVLVTVGIEANGAVLAHRARDREPLRAAFSRPARLARQTHRDSPEACAGVHATD